MLTEPLFAIAGFNFTLINVGTLLLLLIAAFAAGALPGIGPSISIALLIPFLRFFERPVALAALGGVYMAATYGGSITAILMNIPGTGANAATLLDGYPLSKKGQAITAISLSTTASIIGGLIALAIIYFATPYLLQIVVAFGTPEYLIMILFGLFIIAIVSSGNILKGLLAGAFGLMIMSIGVSLQTGASRYTFGIPYFYSGIQFLTVLIGVFALTEMLNLAGTRSQISSTGKLEGSTVDGIKTTFSRITVTVRSSIIGFFVGLVPGAGGAIANFIAYGISERFSNNDEDPPYGEGNPNGVLSAESSNNAVVSGALVPTLTFGIPGSSTTAAILGALSVLGLNPGPQMFTSNLTAVHAIYLGILLSSIFLLVMYWAAPYIGRVTVVDRSILIPFVVVVSSIGIYSLRTSIGDVIMVFVFGIIGYIFVRHDYVIVALILGVILGPQTENYLLRTIDLGGFSLLFTDPLFGLLTLGTTVIIIVSLLPSTSIVIYVKNIFNKT